MGILISNVEHKKRTWKKGKAARFISLRSNLASRVGEWLGATDWKQFFGSAADHQGHRNPRRASAAAPQNRHQWRTPFQRPRASFICLGFGGYSEIKTSPPPTLFPSPQPTPIRS